MIFLFIFYCLISSVCGSYYSSSFSNHHHYGNTSSQRAPSSEAMNLPIERINISMQGFLRSARDTAEDIDSRWYKLDEHDEELKEKNYQNNVLRILLEHLVERFHDTEEKRVDTIVSILDFLNDFIKERFIPGAYQDIIKKIFNYTKELQTKPIPNVTTILFNELSPNAQAAFRDEGVRVYSNGISKAPRGKDAETTHAEPMLVEILFMQLVEEAQKRSSTRQKLIESIETNMRKIEELFENHPEYELVEKFRDIRTTLLKEVEDESPLPALVKYILSLLKNSKNDKQVLENEYKEFLEDSAASEWKKITNVKVKRTISIWQKKDTPPEESPETKKRKEKKEKKKKAIEELGGKAVHDIKEKGFSKDAFSDVMNDVIGSINTLGDDKASKFDAGGLLGSLFGK